MGYATTHSVVRQIELLYDGGSATGLSDRQLLERFNAGRDSSAETAFCALVARHGSKVMQVCRQIVGDDHHAEDAFQAVFLVLACKARTIREPELLGNWLYGVSVRTARRARCRLVRQRKREERAIVGHSSNGSNAAIEPIDEPSRQANLGGDELAILNDEISRLPRVFQLPVVLYYFDGLTLDEVARTLRWPSGTVRSRLARARTKLRRRLSRRGISLSATALTTALTSRVALAHVSSPLCEATTKAAVSFAAGRGGRHVVSASVAALAREMLRSMLLHKLSLLVMGLAVLGAAGAAYAMRPMRMAQPPADPTAQRQQAGAPKHVEKPPSPAAGRMFIAGRVLDPQGKPVANASVMAYARVPRAGRASGALTLDPVSIGNGQSDGSGTFRLDVPRTSSARNDGFGAIAFADGYGAGWVTLDPDAVKPDADISLRPQQVIEVRLFDVQGRQAQGVSVSVSSIRRVLERGPIASRDRVEGLAFWFNDTKDLPVWPKPMVTDAEGRFTLRGIGRDVRVSLTVRDPRFGQQEISIETDDPGDAKQLTMALRPATIIIGRVTYADTGKPAPQASITVGTDREGNAGFRTTYFQADNDGRYRANPSPADRFRVWASAPNGQPYMSVSKSFDWPKGAVEQTVDLVLSRGMLIHGKVTEHGSGKPVAGALVSFNAPFKPGAGSTNLSTQAESAADGSYELVVVPGPGYLAVRGPGDDYVFETIGHLLLFEGIPGGRRFYSNAFVRCEPKLNRPDLDVQVELRPGATVRGRLIAADGRPLQNTWMISRILSGSGQLRAARRDWRGDEHAIARNGLFEIHGLDNDAETPVLFFDPQRKLGATVSFSGRMASLDPVTVRLEPCGSARVRLVDSGGKPLGGFSAPWLISLVVTPGPFRVPRAQKEYPLFADHALLPVVDPINHPKAPTADAHGRISLSALIPGASYRIIDRTTVRDPEGEKVRRDFSVKPGETLDLGDIIIEKPPAMR